MTTQIEQQNGIENREHAIAEHLVTIDSALTPLAPKLLKVKDLSSPRLLVEGKQRLDPTDLVLVHLTDHFPKDGIVHPRSHYEKNFYEPGAARTTIHFTVNSAAGEITGAEANWNDRKYAILIPLDKVKGRVQAFHPSDTFVIDDLELPEGSTVLVNNDNKEIGETTTGKAAIVRVDYAQTGERLSGFQRAVYEQMINLGYFPQRWGEYGWASPSWAQSMHTTEVLNEFCQRNQLPIPQRNSAIHENHWTGILEYLHFTADLAAQANDEQSFERTVYGAEQFLEDFKDIPTKQKLLLVDLLRKYRRYFPGVDLTDLEKETKNVPFELTQEELQEAEAKRKIVDLSKDQEHLFHITNVALLPNILGEHGEGLVSIDFTKEALKAEPERGFDPHAQRDQAIGVNGENLISISDPRFRSKDYGEQTIASMGSGGLLGMVGLIISPRLRGTKYFRGRPIWDDEAFIKRRVRPADIEGIKASYIPLKTSGQEIVKNILDSGDRGRGGNNHRYRFLHKPFADRELDALRESYEEVESKMYREIVDLATELGWHPEMTKSSYRNPIYDTLYMFDFSSVISPKRGVDTERPYIGLDSTINHFMQDTEKGIKSLKEAVEKAKASGEPVQLIPLLRRYLRGYSKLDWAQEPTSIDRTIGLIESVIETRKDRFQIEKQIWERYIEKLTGKPINEVTGQDFLMGICRQRAIPLYDEKGSVLWPL